MTCRRDVWIVFVYFAFIFGPVLDLGIGPISDVNFAVSVLIVVLSILGKARKIPHDVFILLIISLLILIFVVLNTIFLDIENLNWD